MATEEYEGVWLSDRQVDSNEGACGEVLFEVNIPAGLINKYEWKEECKSHREFLVPDHIINKHGDVSVIEVDEVDFLGEKEFHEANDLVTKQVKEIFKTIEDLTEGHSHLQRLASKNVDLKRALNRIEFLLYQVDPLEEGHTIEAYVITQISEYGTALLIEDEIG